LRVFLSNFLNTIERGIERERERERERGREREGILANSNEYVALKMDFKKKDY